MQDVTNPVSLLSFLLRVGCSYALSLNVILTYCTENLIGMPFYVISGFLIIFLGPYSLLPKNCLARNDQCNDLPPSISKLQCFCK